MPPSPAQAPRFGPRSVTWVVAGVIALLTATAYWPGMGGGFTFDDIPNIVDNSAVHVTELDFHELAAASFSSPASTLQRPLAMLTFALNHVATGLDARPMKLTNLVIHVGNSLLVFALARALLQLLPLPSSRVKITLKAGLLSAAWAVCPINVSAVLLVVQRMELLSQTFVLFGLLFYMRGRSLQLEGKGGTIKTFAPMLLCMAAGLLAKESAALLPAYAFAVEAAIFRFAGSTNDRRHLFLAYSCCLVVPAVAAAAWLVPQAMGPGAFASRQFTLGERLLTELRVLVDYASWTLFPKLSHLGLYHDDYEISRGWLSPADTLGSAAVLFGMATLAVIARQRAPLITLGVSWYFLGHLITATIIPLELVFEHRNYFASLGLLTAAVEVVLILGGSRRFVAARNVILMGFVLMLAYTTWLRSKEWSTPITLALSEAQKRPNSARATFEVARMLVVMTEYRKDSPLIGAANRALVTAARVPGANALPEHAELILAARIGATQQDSTWDQLIRKMREQPLTPSHRAVLASMGRCAEQKLCDFPPSRMLHAFSAALSHADDPETLNIFGSYALNVLHDAPLTLKLWSEAVRLRPSEPQYVTNLVRLHIALGDSVQARTGIARLRAMGRAGQNETVARRLEMELSARKRMRKQDVRLPDRRGDGQ